MKLESTYDRRIILDCLKNNLNRIGFSLVWIQAENTDRFILYLFEDFLDEEKADDIAGSILDKHEMSNNCVCTIKLTHGSPYSYFFKPNYTSLKVQRLTMAILDGFNNNKYMNNEVQKKIQRLWWSKNQSRITRISETTTLQRESTNKCKHVMNDHVLIVVN